MSNEELIAELNADLRARDPMVILRRQIRNSTLSHVIVEINNLVNEHYPSPVLDDPWIPVREIYLLIEKMGMKE